MIGLYIKRFNAMSRILSLLLLFSFFGQRLLSQDYWKSTSMTITESNNNNSIAPPSEFQLFHLDNCALADLLFSCSKKTKGESISITLPLPNGTLESFDVYESPIAEEALLNKFPFIKTYTAYNDKGWYARLDFLPSGFHAMVYTKPGIYLIDPAPSKDLYFIYDKNNTKKIDDFVCNTVHQSLKEEFPKTGSTGSQIRTFRLAVSATGEYTDFYGGTIDGALAGIVTSVNRVNLIYEQELATRFLLVADNDKIIYTDPANDPFNNFNINQLIAQNQTNTNLEIGALNYDIGHVFATSGGGLANVAVACQNNLKATGATGLSLPTGDFFNVAYVCHELGHQLSAVHTFNNCQNETSPNGGFEPGSGSTIMAYAGLCGINNVAFYTDYFFHTMSYSKIIAYGNACSENNPTSNEPPLVQATDPTGLTIPISTPFKLSGFGNDPNGDPLLYTWEQTDLGPLCQLGSPTGNAPTFKFIPPSENPKRFFPNMETLLADSSHIGEVLPDYQRSLTFRITARDNFPGSGGVAFDTYSLDVSNSAGPFIVNSPLPGELWNAGETKTVFWDVANTDNSIIGADKINIRLSLDGGQSFDYLLAENLPNNGSASIVVPDLSCPSCRLIVEADDHVFFNINPGAFKIEPLYVPPSINLQANPVSQSACREQSLVYNIVVNYLGGYSDDVSFSLSGSIPSGSGYSFSPPSLSSAGNTSLTINDLSGFDLGPNSLIIVGSGLNGVQSSTTINLNITGAVPSQTTLLHPPTASFEFVPTDELIWADQPVADHYELQVATDPNFQNMVYGGSLSQTYYSLPGLDASTLHFWRVRTVNHCGLGPYSSVFSFHTKGTTCYRYQNGSAYPLSDTSPSFVFSPVSVNENFIIDDINVFNINVFHDDVSDLDLKLLGPNNVQRTLVSNICPGSNVMNFGFDDEAGSASIPCPPSSGTYQPVSSLSVFDGVPSQGTWQLIVSDNDAQGGGALYGWSLDICESVSSATIPELINNNTLNLYESQQVIIPADSLLVSSPGNTPSELIYVLQQIPSKGSLLLNGQALEVGNTFSQFQVNSGLIEYQHVGAVLGVDKFTFAVINNEGGYLADLNYSFIIDMNSLTIDAFVSKAITCMGDNDAVVTILAGGGNGPYQYSLDGIIFTNNNIISPVASGLYYPAILDASGLQQQVANGLEVLDPPALLVDVNTISDNILVNTTGGVPPYMFSLDGTSYSADSIFNDLPNGQYFVYTKDSNECVYIDSVNINVVSIALAENEAIQYYPNPVVDKLLIKAKFSAHCRLHNLQGRLIKYMTLASGKNMLSLEGVPSGVYFISFYNDGGKLRTESLVVLD